MQVLVLNIRVACFVALASFACPLAFAQDGPGRSLPQPAQKDTGAGAPGQRPGPARPATGARGAVPGTDTDTTSALPPSTGAAQAGPGAAPAPLLDDPCCKKAQKESAGF